MKKSTKRTATGLIEKAERRMRENEAVEIEAIKAGAFPAGLDTRKYEEAKAMFEEILQLDPGNQQAVTGIADCEEMLRGYVPVQYMAPAGRVVDPASLVVVEESPTSSQKMPWELLREKRRRDREGMTYTGAVFSETSEEADAQANDIVDKAVANAKKNPRAARTIHDAAMVEIGALQERLDNSWKDHGPEVRDAALARLKAAFKGFDR